ncbi:MAG: sialidase family protein, partial [Terriglobales bacterium]
MAFVALQAVAQDAGGGSSAGQARGGDRASRIQSWFMSGRTPLGDSAAERLRRAYQQKLAMRQAAGAGAAAAGREGRPPATSSFLHLEWSSVGPRPIESDPTLFQSYGLVSGRVTSLVVDQNDATGNTVYIGSANGGVWKSSNAATADADAVMWQPLTDDQPSLAIGALALQPGANGNVGVILAGTGEANNTSDSYYGMGFLRSTDEGATWTNVISADGGTRPLRGLSFSRIAFHTGNAELVVAGASSSNGGSNGAELQGDPGRGMYFSLDAGATWSYAAMNDSGVATQAAAITDVVFNPAHGRFYASVRAHGYYESVNGQTWTRMAQQPGAGLTAANCPAVTNAGMCPLVRGQLTMRAGTGEVFTAWVDAANVLSLHKLSTPGAAWQQMGQTGIDNCGDPGPDAGCGAQNGSFNLTLHALPNGLSTDLYLGAVNIFKCTVTVPDPLCAGSASWKNLTHAFGCIPLGAPAHVHPGQHAIGHSETLPEKMYFANDGGVYRSLNGFALNSDSCAATNPFASLNANLGPLSQFVSLAQPSGDAGMLLGGVTGNGSPLFQASNAGASGLLWRATNLGDGGYTAISPGDANLLYTSFPAGESGVIQRCNGGVNCRQNTWSTVADPTTFGNDGSAFFLPYQLDPKNSATMLAGTCRVWRGPAAGGAFTALSPVFSGGGATCSGGTASGETKVRALAAGGATAVS